MFFVSEPPAVLIRAATPVLTLRRRTDVGYTRHRHLKRASRLQPTCVRRLEGWPRGRGACLHPSRRVATRRSSGWGVL